MYASGLLKINNTDNIPDIYVKIFSSKCGAFVAADDILIPQRDSMFNRKIFKINSEYAKNIYSIKYFKYKYICEFCLMNLVRLYSVEIVKEDDISDHECFDAENIFGELII